jgi:hypothetical protein
LALPTAYLTTSKNLEAVFNSIRSAKAPTKFTQRFLEDLGFKSTADRLHINLLKALGLLSPDGVPSSRYYEFLDQSQSGRVLAEAVEEAYGDLFQLRRDAQNMGRPEVKGKIKTLTQGKVSDAVVDKMAMTFLALANLADFDAPRPAGETSVAEAADGAADDGRTSDSPIPDTSSHRHIGGDAAAIKLGGFVYNVELHLPDSRDPAVYEALFRALKTHLLS